MGGTPWLRVLALSALMAPSVAAPGDGRPDPLPRRAFWGASFSGTSGGPAEVEVRQVEPGGPAARAGLQPGDRIRRIAGRALSGSLTFPAATRALRAGDAVPVELVRSGRPVTVTVHLAPHPPESYSCCDVVYDSVVTARGQRLRTIVTRPRDARGPLPAVLFVGWLSCDTVEVPPEGGDGWARTLRGLVTESGLVTMRVDKPGTGDSEGVCSETDYEAERLGYRAALGALRAYDFVDRDRIVLFGGSMGGATAPLLAADARVRGVAVWGTFVKSWLEHMLEHERRRLALLGDSPARVGEKMRGYGELHGLFLTQQLTPRQVLERRPHLAPLWYDGPEHLYGRPASFHHQAQEANVAAAWEALDVPVLALHGEYDWIMSREDHEIIASIVNGKRPGQARFVSVPKTDHHFMAFDSPEAAFRDEGGVWNREALDTVLAWARNLVGPPPGLAATQAESPAVSFETSVRPVLSQRCAPCHETGGKMYARLPFDDPSVIRDHREGVLRRLKGDEKSAVEAWLDRQR